METTLNKSGFLAVRLHYSDDPATWTPDRVAAVRAAIPGWRWRKEYEIDFAARGGQKVYDAFDPLVHVRPDPVDLAECFRYKVIDHGRRNPTACLWFAEYRGHDRDTVYFYREYYRPDATIAEHSREILKLETKRETRMTLIDPATHRRLDNSNSTIADEYAAAGITTIPADNHLAAGIEAVTAALVAALARWSIDHQTLHPHLAQTAIPASELDALAKKRALYFHPALVNAIRELTHLAWDDHADDNPDQPLCEKITHVDDHAADCVRYALLRKRALPQNVKSSLKHL